MKLYLGLNFNCTPPTHINLYKERGCMIGRTLKAVQEQVDLYGEVEKDYSVYLVNLTPDQITNILECTLNDCRPPDEEIEVLGVYCMTPGRKTIIPLKSFSLSK